MILERCTLLFKMDEWLIVMALPQESQQLFEKAGVKPTYSGLGKINAAAQIGKR